jgi:transposase
VDKWGVYMDIHQLYKQGYKVNRIAKKLGISRNTVYKYLDLSPQDTAIWMAACKTRRKKLDSHQDLVVSWLREHPDISSAQVWDWLKERYPEFKVGESTVREYVSQLRETLQIPKQTVKRFYEAISDPPMGQQAQVDFGEIKVKDGHGTEKKLWFICFVLSHSRYKFAEWLDRPFTTRDVIFAHERAFRFFEGIPYELVYDQDHLLVVNENAGEIVYTAEFQSYRKERDLTIHLCRKADPESKGRIENVVGFVKKNFAKHRVFTNLEKWNEQCMGWLQRSGNGKIHNTTKKRPIEVFALEKPHLRSISHPLSMNAVDVTSITRAVRKDNTIRYLGNRYSVPLGTYRHPGTLVYVTATEDKRLLIRDQPDGTILADHQLHTGSGKLIQVTQHLRDRTKGIEAFMDHTANQFSDPTLAYTYLLSVKSQFPRHIRDQLTSFSQTVKKLRKELADETLKVCIERKLYRAGDFRDVAEFLERKEQKKRTILEEKDTALPRLVNGLTLSDMKPEQRELDVYVSILKGEPVAL